MILPPDNEAINNIMTRVSIRSFTKKEIEKDKLELILRAAMAAPSADDKQPWEFIVIRNKETLKLLSRKLPDAVMLLEADTAITICGNTNKGIKGLEEECWIEDTSAATQNILLSAHALGIGAVWIGVYPVDSKIDIVGQICGLPPYVFPLNIIALGYPAFVPEIRDSWKPDKIHYESW